MRRPYISLLAFWQAAVSAKPVNLQLRQVTNSSLPAVDDGTTLASVSATPGASLSPSGSVTATLFQAENKAFVPTPAAAPTSEPASGCVLATQTPTTITDVFTFNLVESTSYESDFITLSQGLYCTCAGGLMAGLGTSYNQQGTKYLFCATGGLPSTTGAVSTSLPQESAKPGDPLNPDWADVTCDTGSLPNDDGTANPWTMWNDSGADGAWNSMYATWQLDQTDTYLNFSNWLMNYFHGPEGLNCDLVGQGSCDSPASCGQYSSPNAVINSPAGYMIWASMEGLHQILEAFNTGVIEAVGQIGLNVGEFTKQFSPITDELEAIAHQKLVLDIILIVVGVAAVALFEAFIPALPFVTAAVTESIALTTLKTAFYVNFGASLGLVKDRMNPPTLSDVEADVGSYISGVSNALEGAVAILTAAIFDTPDVLHGLIQNGAFFAPGGKTQLQTASAFDVSQKMQEYIFANALPMVWSTGTSAKTAFIATGAGVEGDNGVNGCDGYDPAGKTILGVLQGELPVYPPTDGDATAFYQSTFFCVDNAPYWLLTGHTDSEYKGIYVEEPTNLAGLDGKSWGGISGQDVVASAVNTWKKNGNQNNADVADPTDFDTLQSWATGDLGSVSGLVGIPVCTFQQAAQGATDDKTNEAKNPFWPCPASGPTG